MVRVIPLLLALGVSLPSGSSWGQTKTPASPAAKPGAATPGAAKPRPAKPRPAKPKPAKPKAAEPKPATPKAPARETDAQRRERLRLQRNQRILSREEIEAAMAPHVPAIAACYKKHAGSGAEASGRLALEMLIRPEGTVQSLWVDAPHVRSKKLSECIHALSSAWRFPKKPGFTNAVVPFYFQKTKAKGAGPLKSCWNAKGCPDKKHRHHKQAQPK